MPHTASHLPVVRVLGPVTVGADRQPGTLGANALVALALARSATLTAAALTQAIWPDEQPATRQPLQTLISRLRAAGASGVITTVPGGYALADATVTTDLLWAQAQAASARDALAAGDLERCLDLTGTALGVWREPLGGGASNADLLNELTERADKLEAQLQLTRGEALLAAGQAEQALAELEAAGLATSGDDRFVALHLRSLLAAARATEALDRFAEHRAWLRDTLGSSPSSELLELNTAALRLLDGDRPNESAPPASSTPDAGTAGPVEPSTLANAGGPDGARGGYSASSAPSGTPALAASLLPLSTAPSTHPALPAATTQLVGRHDDIKAVDRLLKESRLVSIVGVGGLGKTRLAYEVAAQAPTQVAVVELAGVRTDTDVELAALAAAIALRTVTDADVERGRASSGATLATAARALSHGPTLLVVDNCEHVLGAASRLIATLLAHAPQLTVLATSRSPLGVTGEQVYPLEALAPTAVDGSPGPAARLFCQRARAVRPAVALDPDVVARLVQHLDGLPLAIELAAARVRSMSVEEIERRLTDRFALLTLGDPAAPARHQTLRAVIDWSWDLLTAAQARLARYLSAFPASFDADAAVTLATFSVSDAAAPAPLLDPAAPEHAPASRRAQPGPSEPAEEQRTGGTGVGNHGGLITVPERRSPLAVLDDLDALVGHSLIQVFESPDTGGLRYRMVETVKDYCLERAREAGEQVAIYQAMAAWARGLARRLVEIMVVPGTQVGNTSVRAEEDNLLTTFRAAVAAGDAATATAVFGSLGTWLSLQGSLFELHELGLQVLDLLGGSGIPAGVEAEGVLACSLLGFVDSLEPTGQADLIARMLAAGLETHGWLPPAVRFLASLVQCMDDPAEAARVCRQGAHNPDPAVRCTATLLFSSFEENAGNVEHAVELGLAAFAEATAGHLIWLRAVSAQMLGGLYSELGVPDKALEWIQRARRYMVRVGQKAANLDITQIEVLGALRAGDIAGAQAILAGWRDQPGARSPETAMVMEMTEAEVEMASGDMDAALARFARTLSAARTTQDVVGPWWLIGESVYVAALCHAGLAGAPQTLAAVRELLGAVTARGRLAVDPQRADHPVIGTVAAAIGVWVSLLTAPQVLPGAPSIPDAGTSVALPGGLGVAPSWGPELLALAERLSSRQDMVTLDRARLWALVGPARRASAEATVASLGPTAALPRAVELMDGLHQHLSGTPGAHGR